MKFYRNVMFMIQRAGYATQATNATRSTPQRLRWTTKESDLLMQLVDKYGKHWAHLETFFDGRSASMLSGRYHYLEKKDKVIPWSVVEDRLLLSKVNEFGKDWKMIEKEFEGQRTKEELEKRYQIAKKVKTPSANYVYTAWTKLETHKMLILAKKYNHDWEMISFKLRTRSKAQCYGRYKRIVDLVNPEDEENIKLTKIQADKVVKAVQVYGLDFKTIRTKLRLTDFTPQELEQVYTTQLDPTFCRDKWSPEETKLLVALYTELDGHMKLVQTRFPTKRSLQDMWDHYIAATQDI